jgi:hypothetical protein
LNIVNKKLFFFIYFFLFIYTISAQKQANQWFFERNNGLDFNRDTVRYLAGCQFDESESSSSICDSNGNMLFYSNGITLYNKYNQIVKNGKGLGFPYTLNLNSTTSRQGTLLLKHPDNDSLIYLFCTDFQGRAGGLVYSVINIHGNKDSGEVIKKKIKLVSPVNEPIHAINHQNGRDVWIVCHKYGGDLFYLYLLKKDGLIECLVTNKIGSFHDGFNNSAAQNNIKFSPNGKYLVHDEVYHGNVECFRFDNESGKVFDTIFQNTLVLCLGYDYSNCSNYIYVNFYDSFCQINLHTGYSKRLINFNQNKIPQQLQLGPDGKIYGAIYQSKDLFVINRPEREGDSCNVIIKSNFLQKMNISAMPNFNQSYFYTPSIDYQYEMNCLSNSIQFWGKDTLEASTYQWIIAKQGHATEATYNTKNITHSFLDTGKYEVTYIASNGQRSDTVSKTITLHPKINKSFLGNDTVYAQGNAFNLTLKAPNGMHCQLWQDSSGLSSFQVDTAGVYYCKVTNQSFCQYTDSIIIQACINNLSIPSIYRVKDSMFTSHPNADSFVWYRNNEVYQITKEPYLKLTDTGTYRVEAAKQDHCNSSSATYAVKKLGIQTPTLQDFGILIYPNPSQSKINIESPIDFKMKVSDVSGKTIHVSYNTESIELESGLYFIQIEVDGYTMVEKVVVY